MDSDDEYERRPRGRDKFRRERSDYNDRSGRRDDRSSRRDEWSDNRRRPWEGQGRRKEYRDFDRDRRDSGGRHHDISPPMKRVRRDWDNVGGYQGEYVGYNPMVNQWSSPMEMQPGVHQRPYDNTQPPVDVNSGPAMMTFKQFLNSMEDTIDDMEPVKKYQEYKVEFRKTQIADFFTTHKDEEWFRNKYHPIESLTYQKKVNAAVRKRAAVFVDLLQSGWLERFSLSVDQGEDIKKLLDAAVIKFEGGSDFDLQILSEPAEQEVKSEPAKENVQPANGGQIASKEINQEQAVSPSSVPLPGTPAPPSASVKNAGFKAEDIKPLEMSDPSPEQLKLREEAEKYHQQQLQQQQKQEQEKEKQEQKENVPQDQGPVKKRKRKRRHREPYYYDENGESESQSESDVESEPAPPGEETAPTDAQERAAEERLLPPGVDTEPISADEAMVPNEDVPPGETIVPPGIEQSQDLVKPKSPETLPADKQKEVPVNNEATRMNISEPDQQPLTVEKQEPDKTENDQPKEPPLEDSVAEPKDSKTNESDVKLQSTETKLEEKKGETSDVKKEEKGTEDGESKMDTTDGTEVKTEPGKEEEEEGPKPEPIPEVKTPQALHRTVSLFVRNVPPKISHNDIASVCSRFPGFMRVVLSDPSPERKFSRRGWITFNPNVNIKDICWTINNIKIKEIELNPIVNRELARRVRTVSGASVLKELVKTDINMATKLIQELDEKFGVWKQTEEEPLKKVEEESKEETETTVEENEEKKSEELVEAVSPPTAESSLVEKETKMETEREIPQTNPVLDLLPVNTPDDTLGKKEETTAKPGDEEGQLTEEGQVAEDDQIPVVGQPPEHPAPVVDESLIKLLDRLLLYLRIVHSLDYYSGAEYLYEDDMPNRCGIINIRNPLPEKVNYEEVTEWHKNLHQKLDQHLQKKEQIQDEEANQLGKKDQEQEMEKFIQANTQELAKDKWLCPLSGKKFRGPEFVKKHIFNKHADKVDGVKTEVTFFNNFVYDPKRPCESEVRSISQGSPGNQHFPGAVSHPVGMQGTMGWGRGVGMMQGGRGGFHISPNYRSGPDQYNNRGQSYQPKPRRGGSLRRDPRPIVQYKDLDAPGDDVEFF